MNLQEAREFVAHFTAGEYTPEKYAAFLQWLRGLTGGATAEELTIIADMHESMHDSWILPEGPTSEWVMQLERKLDRSMEGAEVEEHKLDEEITVMGEREWEGAPVVRMHSAKRVRNIW